MIRLYSILWGFIFYIMNVLVLGVNQTHDPFFSTFSIAIPFEENNVLFTHLIFNYMIIAIFIFNIIHQLKHLFSMSIYFLSRTNRRLMYWLFLRKVVKNSLFIVLIKLLVDLLTGQMNGFIRLDNLVKLYISFLLTLIIWILLLFILYTLSISENKIIFTTLTITWMSQYLSITFPFVNIVVVVSPAILKHFILWCVLKLSTIIILLLVSYRLFQNKEFIGDVKND